MYLSENGGFGYLPRGSKEIKNTHIQESWDLVGSVLSGGATATPPAAWNPSVYWVQHRCGGWLAVEADSDNIQEEEEALVARPCTHRSLIYTGSPKESFAIALEPHPAKTLPLWD